MEHLNSPMDIGSRNRRKIRNYSNSMRIYHALVHLGLPMDLGSSKALCQVRSNVSSNSCFVGLRLVCTHIWHKRCPQTHNFVSLRLPYKVEGCNWVDFGSSRCDVKPTIYWVSSSISRIRSPAGLAPNPQFTEFGA